LLDSIQSLLHSFSDVTSTQFLSTIKTNKQTEDEKQDEDDREPPPREPQPPEFSLPTQQDHIVAQLKDENQVLHNFYTSYVSIFADSKTNVRR